MNFINDSNIKESDVFQSVNFPLMVNELGIMKNELTLMPGYFKAEIIISYLKNHSIKNDWVKANPELTELITSGACATAQIESIFRSCIKHKIFLNDFETYIRSQILN